MTPPTARPSLVQPLRSHVVTALVVIVLIVLATVGIPVRAAGNLTLTLEPVATGLDQPTFVTEGPDGRLYILEQHGRIRVVRNGKLLPTPFLDIRSRIICCAEEGLLGLAFDPGYLTQGSQGFGRFYVTYADRYDGHFVLAEFRHRAGHATVAPSTERRLMDLAKPYRYHFAGMLAFGPDGHLWVAVGDGGHPEGATAVGDPLNNAQRLTTRLGKILRIDPHDPDGAGPKRYGIPPDGPFVGQPGKKGEIWAYGLRNPWRFSFDRLTGDLWIGDVGHSLREEIDVARAASGRGKGANYGWRLLEGTRCYNPATACDPDHVTVKPHYEYIHNYSSGGELNCAVAGGYVYRGVRSPALVGRYVFGDYCSGRIWTLPAAPGQPHVATLLRNTKLNITSFGEDADGELYVCDLSGKVFHIVVTAS